MTIHRIQLIEKPRIAPTISIESKVQGFYKLTKLKRLGNGKEIVTQEVDWFPNLITNAGLNRMATEYDYLESCMVGSGSATPAVTDNALDTFIVATAYGGTPIPEPQQELAQGTKGSSPYYTWLRQRYRFFEGQATGNISEVGVGWYNTAWFCFSRALVLDGGGSPTTITVLSDEVLDVTYELRFYPKLTDSTGNVTFTGNIGGTYSYTIRQAYCGVYNTGTTGWNIAFRTSGTGVMQSRYMTVGQGNYGTIAIKPIAGDGTLGAITTIPSSSNTDQATNYPTPVAYVTDSFEAESDLKFELNDANFGAGISVIHHRLGYGWFQIGFGSPIMKTATDELTIRLKHSWGRV